MSALGWLEQLGLGNNTSEEDELTRVSAIRKESEGLDVPVAPLVSNMHPATRSYIDNQVRQVVKEELEKGNLMHYIQCFLSRQGNVSEPRRLSLVFSQNVSSPVLTGRKIKGNGGIFINLALVDRLTREVVKNGPEAAAKVEILVLKADRHEACNGKYEDLNNRIVGKIQGKNSVLQGTTALKLKEGICSIDNLSFTHNACWTRNSKFCLGARAVNSFLGTTIEPAETEPFDLKDNRVTAYAKKEVPSLLDKVSRLKHIGRGITKRLNDGSINTVEDFLVVLDTNPQRLHEILKVGPKKWEEITDHAKTCIFDDKDAQRLVVREFDQWERLSIYNDVDSVMEHFPQTLASTMTKNPSQFITWDSPLFATVEQADIASCNIFTSTNCIGESSRVGSPKQSLWGPIYSPPYYDEEFLHFMTFNDQPERLSLELKPKLSWFIICVSRWLVIRRRVGSLEAYRVNKKQKIP